MRHKPLHVASAIIALLAFSAPASAAELHARPGRTLHKHAHTHAKPKPVVSGPPAGWTPDGATPVLSTAYAQNGTTSVRVTPTGVDDWPGIESPYFVPTPGETYTAHVWWYAPSALVQRPFVQIDFEDANHVDIAQPSTPGSTTLPVGTWTEIVLTATAPAGAVWMNVQPNLTFTPPATDVYYVDHVWVTRQSDGAVVFADNFDTSR
jgi:hypothetical protein